MLTHGCGDNRYAGHGTVLRPGRTLMADAEPLAFDMYGTLVDPIRIWRALEQDTGDAAVQIAEVWRQKQLEL